VSENGGLRKSRTGGMGAIVKNEEFVLEEMVADDGASAGSGTSRERIVRGNGKV
jgi:hypothetical protein